MRYASELTHARVQGPLEFVLASPSSASAEEAADIKTARKYLDLYFHQVTTASLSLLAFLSLACLSLACFFVPVSSLACLFSPVTCRRSSRLCCQLR